MYDYCSICSEMLLDGYYRYSDPTDCDGGDDRRCCSEAQREFLPLCDGCKSYGKCDACRKEICVFCVQESSSQFQCCGLKLCGAGCSRNGGHQLGNVRPAQEVFGEERGDTPFATEEDEPMSDGTFLRSCGERHSATHLPCGPNHVGCNFYPGYCRTCEELCRDSAECEKRQRDINLLLTIVDNLESKSVRASLRGIVGDRPEKNVKRKQNLVEEERIVGGLERSSLKRARRTPDCETDFRERMEQFVTP